MGANIPRNISGASSEIIKAFLNEQLSDVKEAKAEQREALDEGLKGAMLGAPNIKTPPKDKKIKAHMTRVQKMQQAGDVKKMLPIEQIKDSASEFQRRNPELKADTLVLLRESINPDDSKEEILRKLLEFYPDISLADEALEFLLATTDGELAQKIREIKEELNAQRGPEIRAGRNIHAQARAASEKGLGTPTSLRDMYRDVVNNPREAPTLFDELSQKYSYDDMKKVLSFLLHSLGADMKSKGPSIEPGELSRLFNETRTLQAILGVHRFFRSRINLVKTLFENSEIQMPPELTPEKMSKEFMALASERHPSPDKVLERANRLGLKDTVDGKIIALSQFRDAVREVSANKIYKSIQHRDDLFENILTELEELEDLKEQMEIEGGGA